MASCRSAPPAQTLLPIHFYSSISQQNCNYPYIINYNFSRHYCPPWGRPSLHYFMKRGSNRLPVLKRQSERRYSVNRVRAAGDSDEVMKPPFNVLITGSSKGIGYALAKEFLSAGDNVIICSRSDDHVQAAIANLRGEFGDQRVWGTTCDVRDGENVRALVDFTKKTIRYIDIWINNAGSNAYSYKPLVETDDEALMEVVTTNTLGTMICCREAIMMMMGQPRGGHIFNIDGAGADGSPTPRFAAYGATKRSLVHLTKSLQDMLAAGTDTASTSLDWTMAELVKNPPVMKKLQGELERVVGFDRMVSESDLPSLVYLQAVMKEMFRLHPPGPFGVPHASVEDCTILGYQIPKGTRVLVNLWEIGTNPESWGEDADTFNPERFMEAGSIDSRIQNFEWLPFGGGRRGCPGQQLGTLVIELAVAQLLHCFNWRLPLNGRDCDLDMTEKFNGLTLPRAHELWAVPTPRLPVL